MELNYLQNLIDEVKTRGGGLILNLNNKPEVVVLTIEKYNQILAKFPEDNSDDRNLSADLFSDQKIVPRPPIPKLKILVTGGAGYIGAHVSRKLLSLGHQVIVLDNLSSGKRENVPLDAKFMEGDLSDINFLRDIFASHAIDIVCHLAASVEVEESVKEPQKYFENNALNTAKLLSVMNEFNVKKIIFSSTCAVYGKDIDKTLTENSKVEPENPYGYTKYLAEQVIKYYSDNLGFISVVFRYFNAAGCDFDGDIVPTHASHLIPNILQVVAGEKQFVLVNGEDYDTSDGTCVRDFIHVLDISLAHEFVLENIKNLKGFRIYNIGSETGQSVLSVIKATSEILNHMVPMEIGPRREGDAVVLVADSSKIREELGFKPRYSDLNTIISTAWNQYKKSKNL